jgi:predicted O-methyltransferase YrrM
MVKYDLEHLTQGPDQRVCGPIQDDEALFIYSIIKGMRLTRVLEIGGLNGYSALNFLKSMDQVNGTVYTVDINPVPIQAPNHVVIIKNALGLTASDFGGEALDLVFFDCHDMAQMVVYHMLVKQGIINDNTILALHDTNLHYDPYQMGNTFVPEEGGFAHQPVERQMVNIFKAMGYDVFCLHTTRDKHSDNFPFRHGLTICKRFKYLH